jgi:hypothetical protein
MNITLWLSAILIVGGAGFWKGMSVGEANIRAENNQDYVDQSKQVALANQLLHDQVAKLDTEHTKENFDAQETIDNLLTDIDTGKRRLFIPTAKKQCTVPSNTDSTSVDNGTSRTELDRLTSKRIITLTNRGDKAIRQLSACQDYVKAISSVSTQGR